MRVHGIVEADQIENHQRWSQEVGLEEGIDPFDWEASPAEVDTGPFGWEASPVEVDTGPFDLGACLVEEGIDLEGYFVAVERPWRSVEALQEGVHLLVLDPFHVADELLHQRPRQSFDHRSLLDHRGQLNRCWQN